MSKYTDEYTDKELKELEKELLNEHNDYPYVESYQCEKCGWTGIPKSETFDECIDADGRNGKEVTYITCKSCWYETVI